MPTIYRNTSGAGVFGTTTQIVAPGDIRGGAIRSIMLSNARDSADAEAQIDLFIQNVSETGKNTETYYLIRNTVIPPGTTLILDEPAMLSFDLSKFALFIKLAGSSDAIDVIIRT